MKASAKELSSFVMSDMYNPIAPEDKGEQDSQSAEDYEALLPDGSRLPNRQHREGIPKICLDLFTITAGILVALSLVGLEIWIGCLLYSSRAPSLEEIQKWSPILKEVDNSYHMVRFNGSLLKENVFRQEAGPEVDAAWASIGVNYRSLAVPVEQAARSGLERDQVQINPKYGGGFPANVEGLHHLHCLNLLRQSLYYNIDYYRSQGKGAFLNEGHIVRHHVSHCLDIIRQQLMCTPDTGLLGQVWWDVDHPKSFVDFNTEHKCKNFDAIRQWAEERQLPETVPHDFLKPPQTGDTIYEEIP